MLRFLIASLVVGVVASTVPAVDPKESFFEAKIRPVLVEKCYSCHGQEKQKGGLRLDSKAAMTKGGDSGVVVVPGKPDASLLIKALRYEEPKMPPAGRLADSVVSDFTRWIADGAFDPREGKPVSTSAIDFEKAREFWSFQPVRPQPVPKVSQAAWPRSRMDYFILAGLDAAQLAPSSEASKHEWLRRVTFDLIGLPPKPEEVDAFLRDTSSEAHRTVVDRLLASPHYGERWGRHWLDVARYAEDQAHTFAVKPYSEAWRYRDWVIGALNDDVPYDRFLRLQIAADLMDLAPEERRRHLPALGFFGLGAQYYKNSDAAKAAADELDDRIDTLARGMLGLTVSCARCHDHKFDPIPTQDYYSLAGVFANTKLTSLPLASREETQRYEAHQKQIQVLDEGIKATFRQERARAAAPYVQQVAAYVQAAWQAKKKLPPDPGDPKLPSDAVGRWTKFLDGNPKMVPLERWRKLSQANMNLDAAAVGAELQKFVQEIVAESATKPLPKPKDDVMQALFGEKGVHPLGDETLKKAMPASKKAEVEVRQNDLKNLQKTAPQLPMTHALTDTGTADLKVYVRGNPSKQGEAAPRRFLRVLSGGQAAAFSRGSGRLELADCIASPSNPLTARVMVNRVWAWHFGRGLVATPSNFGQLGERPTHPELLDDLTSRFIDNGWSLKWLHREIVLSATYRLSSQASEKQRTVDAGNRFYGRMNRRRLEIEAWRDSLMAVSGRLDPTLGGPTFDLAGNSPRRTVYAKISRHNLDMLLRLFDFPEANLTAEQRTETTVPQQQLLVLNSPLTIDAARSLAARVTANQPESKSAVQQLFLLCFGRPASENELSAAQRFLNGVDAPDEKASIRLTRWERLAQAVLASNEFLYVD